MKCKRVFAMFMAAGILITSIPVNAAEITENAGAAETAVEEAQPPEEASAAPGTVENDETSPEEEEVTNEGTGSSEEVPLEETEQFEGESQEEAGEEESSDTAADADTAAAAESSEEEPSGTDAAADAGSLEEEPSGTDAAADAESLEEEEELSGTDQTQDSLPAEAAETGQVPEESTDGATDAEELTEEALKEETSKSPVAAIATEEKLIDYGGDGTREFFEVGTSEKTNGFSDDVVDISSGIGVATLPDQAYWHDEITANGEYQKIRVGLMLPKNVGEEDESSEYIKDIDEETNGVHYEFTGPNVKKEVEKEAYDSDYYITCGSTNLTVKDNYEVFDFDHVATDRMMKWLCLPVDNHRLMTDIHLNVNAAVTSYPLEELRKYGSAREYVEAKGIMQSDERYLTTIGSEQFITHSSHYHELGDDIDAFCREHVDDYRALGYTYTVETYYSIFIGIPDGSKYLTKFLELEKEGEFSAYVCKDGVHWFGQLESKKRDMLDYSGRQYIESFLQEEFGDDKPADYQLMVAPYDTKFYSLYFDFSWRDLINAWLNEMENWDGHWNYLLYGAAAVPEMESDDDNPGYNSNNWIYGYSDGRIKGKVTVHHPTKYTYYVKDPGTYTLTVTVDGCKGKVVKQIKVVEPKVDPIPLNKCSISSISDKVYSGKAWKPVPVIKYDGKTLVEGVDYTLTYGKNTSAGDAYVTIEGIGKYSGSVKKVFKIKPAANKITASNIVRSCSAEAQKFPIGAKAAAGTITYKSDNKKITVNSKGVVTIAGLYSGMARITMTAKDANHEKAVKTIIVRVPPEITVTSAKSSAAGSAELKWKRNTYVTGYQIRFSMTSKYTKKNYIDIKSNTKTSAIIKKLAKGKIYYIQIRSYKIVNKKRYYSGWSRKFKVRIRK